MFNEPDSDYTAATTGTDCTHRNGVWVGSASVVPVPAGKRFGDAVGRQRPRRQRAGRGLLVPRRQAGRLEPESHAAGRRLQLLLVELYALDLLLPRRVLPRAVGDLPAPTGRDRAEPVHRRELRGAERRQSGCRPASSGLPSAQGAIAAIDQVYPSGPPVWFTEVGVWLTDGGKEPVTSACGDGNPQDDGTWSACLNGNPTAQALAAEGYLRLPEESRSGPAGLLLRLRRTEPGLGLGPGQRQPAAARTARIRHAADHVVRALRNYAHGATPRRQPPSDAVRPGSRCDLAQHRRRGGVSTSPT